MSTFRPKSELSALLKANQRKARARTITTTIRIAPRYDGGVYGSGDDMGKVCAARNLLSSIGMRRRRRSCSSLNVLAIHPWIDGNGRSSRVLSTLELLRAGVRAPELVNIEP